LKIYVVFLGEDLTPLTFKLTELVLSALDCGVDDDLIKEIMPLIGALQKHSTAYIKTLKASPKN